MKTKNNIIELREALKAYAESKPELVKQIETQFIEVGSGINWEKAVAAGVAYPDEGEQSIEEAVSKARNKRK